MGLLGTWVFRNASVAFAGVRGSGEIRCLYSGNVPSITQIPDRLIRFVEISCHVLAANVRIIYVRANCCTYRGSLLTPFQLKIECTDLSQRWSPVLLTTVHKQKNRLRGLTSPPCKI